MFIRREIGISYATFENNFEIDDSGICDTGR